MLRHVRNVRENKILARHFAELFSEPRRPSQSLGPRLWSKADACAAGRYVSARL